MSLKAVVRRVGDVAIVDLGVLPFRECKCYAGLRLAGQDLQ